MQAELCAPHHFVRPVLYLHISTRSYECRGTSKPAITVLNCSDRRISLLTQNLSQARLSIAIVCMHVLRFDGSELRSDIEHSVEYTPLALSGRDTPAPEEIRLSTDTLVEDADTRVCIRCDSKLA
jgi:hypothetical protein